MQSRRLASTLALLFATGALGACHGSHPASPQSFLDQNGKEKGVTTLADGLEYRVVASGPADGPHPAKDDEVKVDYTGSLVSGAVFDSTNATGAPAVLKLDHLVPAWMEALPRMRPGDEWLIYAPPALGYGADGRPPVIPPNSVLVFDVKLLGVLQANGDGQTRYATAGAPAGPPPKPGQQQQPEGPSLLVNSTGAPAQ